MTTIASLRGRAGEPIPRSRGARSNVSLPEDLRGWQAEPVLVQLALQAATEAEFGRPVGRAPGAESPVGTPALLTLLVYCYATGRFGSEGIEAAWATDGALRYLTARQSPSAAVLRRFRRNHRAQLEPALNRMLLSCWRLRGAAAPVWRALSQPRLGTSASLPLSALQDQISEETRARVERAILEDSVAADW